MVSLAERRHRGAISLNMLSQVPSPKINSPKGQGKEVAASEAGPCNSKPPATANSASTTISTPRSSSYSGGQKTQVSKTPEAQDAAAAAAAEASSSARTAQPTNVNKPVAPPVRRGPTLFVMMSPAAPAAQVTPIPTVTAPLVVTAPAVAQPTEAQKTNMSDAPRPAEPTPMIPYLPSVEDEDGMDLYSSMNTSPDLGSPVFKARNLDSPTLPSPDFADHDVTVYTPRTTQHIILEWVLTQWHQGMSQSIANLASVLANCRFEHLNTNRQNQNPFSALSNTRGGSDGNTYNLNRDTIVRDLTEERPSWLLSAYSPSRDLPEQLWGGQLEQSFEEMRLHFMTGAAAGNPQGALNDIQQLEAQAQQKIQAAVSNPDAAIGYIQQAGNNHPNRQDLCRNDPSRSTGEFAVGKRPVGIASPQAPNAFSQPAPTSNPFGQPSALGQRPNPFSTGTSGFGQQSGPSQSSPFGQPSALGQTSALGGGGFGQTSSLGQNSTLGGGGFGQASALGQKPNPFGQPSSLGQAAGTGFGQTPSLGQKPNPFGNTGFGQASQLGAKPNPFGSGGSASSASPFSAFAANNSNNTSTASPFSALSGANNNSGTSGLSGQPPTGGGFGQPQQPASTEVSMDGNPTPITGGFGGPANNAAAPANPFGQPAQSTTSAFGQPAQPAANPFAAAAPQPSTTTTSAAVTGPYAPNASRQHPPFESYATKAPNGQLQMWKGQQVAPKEIDDALAIGTQNFGQGWSKIWFPDGPPPYYKETEPEGEYTEADKAKWKNFMATGKFDLATSGGGGGMPEAPPLREFVQWDF